MEIGDAAGVVGGLAGVAAFVTSLVGLSRSKEANRIAGEANSKSDESNGIARESNDLAREANGIAETATTFAREANELAQRQELRSTESHAIQWQGEWVAPGEYALTCRGSSTALNVVAVVTVDGEEVKEERERIDAPGRIDLTFPRARQTLLRERVEYAESRRLARSALVGGIDDRFRYLNHSIETWVHWKTETGRPMEYRKVWNMESLGDLD
ncbi:hypothetical protein [Streptomyces olivaceus]|uniref:hypothetical protein n=1 Tax=Streptomyces olivaceus TaxID=47716 RepID=UPI0022ED98A8|nr:hypothetical protein [Streptomyces olivaceus]GHI91713.1 hypothetical protein TPA0905_11840 [Streptomyces olivaceus]